MTTPPCKHPVVRVVSRHDDVEFVECQSCREVFDSVEYEDVDREAEGGTEDGAELLSTPRGANGARKGRRTGSRPG